MFEHTSRYYKLETAQFTTANGQRIVYKRRRFLPQAKDMPLYVEIIVKDSDRLDLITARTLGVSEQFWQICDANNTMNPAELTAEPGQRLRVPVPQV